MAKPKVGKKNVKQPEAPNATIPAEAVPYLFNQKILEWNKVRYQALVEIHKVLVEIRDILKE
jgi:hypothetical protein